MKATEDEAKTEFILTGRLKLTNFSCYEELVNAFSQRCFHLAKVSLVFGFASTLIQITSKPKIYLFRL